MINEFNDRYETFTFSKLPETLDEFKKHELMALDKPFKTAAMTVIALCVYAKNKDIGLEMLNILRGPRPLNGQDISFLNDRFRGKEYLPYSYFEGANAENNYTPNIPYKISIISNAKSGEESGYMKIFIQCGGADEPRPIKLRQRQSDAKWFLWEQYLMTGIRTPKSQDPWA